jgi:hypothetical protein
VEEVEDRYIELGYLLDDWHHLLDLQSHREEDCQLIPSHSFEPNIYPLVPQLLPQHERFINDED